MHYPDTNLRSVTVACVTALLAQTASAQFLLLQPGSSGDIDFGTRDIGAGGAATQFSDAGNLNGSFGRLVDPGSNFGSLDAWAGGVPVVNVNGGLNPGLQRFVPRGADGAGTPNNFGPGRVSIAANNNGIGFNFGLSDPKPVGHVNGVDGSVIEILAEGTWRAAGNLNGLTLGMGLGLNVNLRQAGNYVAASLTGQYRVNGGGWFTFTPIVFASDGRNGLADFISADLTSPNSAWLGDANPANDVTIAYQTWGASRAVVGQAGAPNILPGNNVDFRMYFTAMADPEADMDIFDIPSSELAPTDFGGSYSAVPEPSSYAAIGAAGLVGFGLWRRSRRPQA
jgi:PEP-CTERM motif